MSIAYIVSMRSGMEAFIYREVEALRGLGCNIALFATKFKRGDVYSPKPDWPVVTTSILRLLLELPVLVVRMLSRPSLLLSAARDGGLVDLLYATRFAPIMRRMRIRQVHAHFGDHKLFIAYYCKQLTGLPLSVTLHAHEFFTNPNVHLFRKALSDCDRIFPIAQLWSDLLQKEYGVPSEKIYLNRLFVDPTFFGRKPKIRVLAVGRFTPRKGFDYLIEAASQLEDDIELVFAGFGEIDLNRLAQEHGVAERVTVFPKLDQKQLRVLYQQCDILCVPSITTKDEGAEGIPVVLMEGMAAGLPVIATRCGATHELVADILIEERSVEQLVRAIRALASSPLMRDQQATRNREIVLESYSPDNVKLFRDHLIELG